MKLLFDQNLSPRLTKAVQGLFPGSTHVSDQGLSEATDHVVWEYAKANDFAIVTKDNDFNELNQLRGFPPLVIWIKIGNCTTQQIIDLLHDYAEDIKGADWRSRKGLLIMY